MDEKEQEKEILPEQENRPSPEQGAGPTPETSPEPETGPTPEAPPEPEAPPAPKKESRSFPPLWLMCAMGVCLILTGIALSARSEGGQSQAAGLRHVLEIAPRPSQPPRLEKRLPEPQPPEKSPEPSPIPSPEPTPEVTDGVPPTLEEAAVPEGTAYDTSWFSDAVLIGDSRMNGFQLYSDVKEASYLTCTGLSIYKVAEEEKVIRRGEDRISVYEALKGGSYAKVYLSMGVNELGYYNPEGFAETFGKVVDKIRELQPGADIYVMTIIPVNSEKCREYKQREYVNNTLVKQYNEALVGMAEEKDVYLINVAEALTDETGEVPTDLSADGVHFKKEGYLKWRDYLLCHTGT